MWDSEEKVRLFLGLEKNENASLIFKAIINDIALGFIFTRNNLMLNNCYKNTKKTALLRKLKKGAIFCRVKFYLAVHFIYFKKFNLVPKEKFLFLYKHLYFNDTKFHQDLYVYPEEIVENNTDDKNSEVGLNKLNIALNLVSGSKKIKKMLILKLKK